MIDMYVNVTPSQFDLLQRCVIKFDMGLLGPNGETPNDIKKRLEEWAGESGGTYDRSLHDAGHSVRIIVVYP